SGVKTPSRRIMAWAWPRARSRPRKPASVAAVRSSASSCASRATEGHLLVGVLDELLVALNSQRDRQLRHGTSVRFKISRHVLTRVAAREEEHQMINAVRADALPELQRGH